MEQLYNNKYIFKLSHCIVTTSQIRACTFLPMLCRAAPVRLQHAHSYQFYAEQYQSDQSMHILTNSMQSSTSQIRACTFLPMLCRAAPIRLEHAHTYQCYAEQHQSDQSMHILTNAMQGRTNRSKIRIEQDWRESTCSLLTGATISTDFLSLNPSKTQTQAQIEHKSANARLFSKLSLCSRQNAVTSVVTRRCKF